VKIPRNNRAYACALYILSQNYLGSSRRSITDFTGIKVRMQANNKET